jgi:hypothetical protein
VTPCSLWTGANTVGGGGTYKSNHIPEDSIHTIMLSSATIESMQVIQHFQINKIKKKIAFSEI